jgi:hypothetical protein
MKLVLAKLIVLPFWLLGCMALVLFFIIVAMGLGIVTPVVWAFNTIHNKPTRLWDNFLIEGIQENFEYLYDLCWGRIEQ